MSSGELHLYEIHVRGEAVDDFEALSDTEAKRVARKRVARLMRNAEPRHRRAFRAAVLMVGVTNRHGEILRFRKVSTYPFAAPALPGYRHVYAKGVYTNRDRGRRKKRHASRARRR